MTHELHQGRQADAGADHVRCERVAESVRVGLSHAGGTAVMTEQGTQPRGGHTPPPGPPLEADEQRRTTVEGPLQAQVVIQQLDGFSGQWQPTRLTPLASHAHLRFRQQQVVAIKREYFARAQAIQEHQTYDGQISRSAEAGPKVGHFVRRQRDYYAFRRLHAQSAQRRTRPSGAERRGPPIAVLKAGDERNLCVREREPQSAFGNPHAAVEAGGGGPRLLIGLEANIVEQGGFGERLLGDRRGMVYPHPPAQEMEQIVGIAAQRGFGDATHPLPIQETVDPFHLLAVVLYDAKRSAGVFQIAPFEHTKVHGIALSSRR